LGVKNLFPINCNTQKMNKKNEKNNILTIGWRNKKRKIWEQNMKNTLYEKKKRTKKGGGKGRLNDRKITKRTFLKLTKTTNNPSTCEQKNLKSGGKNLNKIKESTH